MAERATCGPSRYGAPEDFRHAMKIAVLGAGAWGTAIAISLAQLHAVTLWTRDSRRCEELRTGRTNEKYLPGQRFPARLEVTDAVADAVNGADLTLIAVATAGLRETLHALKTANARMRLVWLCKGFEPGQAKL